jgi:CDP-glucose 4,6-dehydratase
MNRILVTGASGIVGSWLVKELLAQGRFVVCFLLERDPGSELIRSGDIDRTRVVEGRLEHFRDVERAILLHDIDTVFHLGAQTLVEPAYRSPVATLESNVQGTWNLLEACRIHGTRRVVVASSDKAYGDHGNVPYTEETQLLARNPYDVSKSCADLITQAFASTYDMNAAIARCGNIYGGGDLNWSRIVPGTIRSLLQGERPVLRSDGTCVRDYVYVKDIVRAYIRLAESDFRGEAFNFSNDKGVPVLEIVKSIATLAGREDLEPEIQNTMKAEIQSQTLDSSKARRELGWKPEYDLASGLEETFSWYREYLA